MSVPTEIVKNKSGQDYLKGYILDVNPFDDVLKFESVADNIEEGLFNIRLDALFIGGDRGYAPPIANISANIVTHGLLKVYKIISEIRPADRPVLASEAAPEMRAYSYANNRVESLIFPSSDPNSLIYEPKFFYDDDSSSFGYFVQQELIVNINQQNPAHVRWGSSIPGRNTALKSGVLRLMKIYSL